MATILPSPNFRECTSCLRDLSLGLFGMQRVRSDLYNDVCKECRRYRRRAFYYRALERNGFPNPQGAASALPYVFPVNEQNRHVLAQVISGLRSSPLSAQFIKTGQSATVVVELVPDHPSFSVYVADRLVSTHLCGTLSLEQFTEVAVSIFREMRIRLD